MARLYSCNPVAGKEIVDFVQSVIAGGKSKEIAFSREIIWLRESQSRNVEMHGGEYLNQGLGDDYSQWTDFYGFCTSLDAGLGAAKRDCKRFAVDEDSSLVLAIEGRVIDRPVLFGEAPKREGWRTGYDWVPLEWRLVEVETETCKDGSTYSWHPRLESRIVKPWTTVWSSANGADADRILEQTIAEWRKLAEKPQATD